MEVSGRAAGGSSQPTAATPASRGWLHSQLRRPLLREVIEEQTPQSLSSAQKGREGGVRPYTAAKQTTPALPVVSHRPGSAGKSQQLMTPMPKHRGSTVDNDVQRLSPSLAYSTPGDVVVNQKYSSTNEYAKFDDKSSFYSVVQEYERNLASVRKERDHLVQQVKANRRQLDDANATIRALEAERREMLVIRGRTDTSAALQETLEKLADAQRKIRDLEVQKYSKDSDWEHERQGFESRVQSAEHRAAELQTLMATNAKQMQSMQEQLRIAHRNLLHAQDAESSAAKQAVEWQEHARDCERQLADALRQSSESADSLSSKLAQSNLSLKHAEAELIALRAESAALAKKAEDGMRASREAKESEQATSHLAEAWQKQAKGLEQQLAEASRLSSESADSLGVQLSQARLALTRAEAELIESRADSAATVRKHAEAAAAREQMLKQDSKDAAERCSVLQRQLAAAASELNDVRSKHADDKAALAAQHRQEVQRLQEEHVDKLKRQHDDHEETRARDREATRTLQAELESATTKHQEAMHALQAEHADNMQKQHVKLEEMRVEAVRQAEEAHASSRRHLAQVAGDTEAHLVREHAQEVRRRQEAADMRLRALENTHKQELETVKQMAASDQETALKQMRHEIDKERAEYKRKVDELSADLQAATAGSQMWNDSHDRLAEAMHQLLLVLESRVQPEALRTARDGSEGGAAIAAMRKLLTTHFDSADEFAADIQLSVAKYESGRSMERTTDEGGNGDGAVGWDFTEHGGKEVEQRADISALAAIVRAAGNETTRPGDNGVPETLDTSTESAPVSGAKHVSSPKRVTVRYAGSDRGEERGQIRLWQQSGAIRWDDLYRSPRAETLHAHFNKHRDNEPADEESGGRRSPPPWGGGRRRTLKMRGAPIGTPRGRRARAGTRVGMSYPPAPYMPPSVQTLLGDNSMGRSLASATEIIWEACVSEQRQYGVERETALLTRMLDGKQKNAAARSAMCQFQLHGAKGVMKGLAVSLWQRATGRLKYARAFFLWRCHVVTSERRQDAVSFVCARSQRALRLWTCVHWWLREVHVTRAERVFSQQLAEAQQLALTSQREAIDLQSEADASQEQAEKENSVLRQTIEDRHLQWNTERSQLEAALTSSAAARTRVQQQLSSCKAPLQEVVSELAELALEVGTACETVGALESIRKEGSEHVKKAVLHAATAIDELRTQHTAELEQMLEAGERKEKNMMTQWEEFNRQSVERLANTQERVVELEAEKAEDRKQFEQLLQDKDVNIRAMLADVQEHRRLLAEAGKKAADTQRAHETRVAFKDWQLRKRLAFQSKGKSLTKTIFLGTRGAAAENQVTRSQKDRDDTTTRQASTLMPNMLSDDSTVVPSRSDDQAAPNSNKVILSSWQISSDSSALNAEQDDDGSGMRRRDEEITVQQVNSKASEQIFAAETPEDDALFEQYRARRSEEMKSKGVFFGDIVQSPALSASPVMSRTPLSMT